MDVVVNKMVEYGKTLIGTKRYNWSNYEDMPGEDGLTKFNNTFGWVSKC